MLNLFQTFLSSSINRVNVKFTIYATQLVVKPLSKPSTSIFGGGWGSGQRVNNFDVQFRVISIDVWFAKIGPKTTTFKNSLFKYKCNVVCQGDGVFSDSQLNPCPNTLKSFKHDTSYMPTWSSQSLAYMHDLHLDSNREK